MSDHELAKTLFFKGLAFLDSRDFVNAEKRFQEALKLAPNSVPVLTNLAAALFAQEKFDEALDYSQKGARGDSSNIEAHLVISHSLAKKKRYAEALVICDKIIALEPTSAEAYINRAIALIELYRPKEALASCDQAIALAPNFAGAYCSRGSAFNQLARRQDALVSYDKAIDINPNLARAWIGRGNTLGELNRPDEAAVAYGKALAIDADFDELLGSYIHAKMRCCDWSNFDVDCSNLTAGIEEGLPLASPFVTLGLPVTAEHQFKCAQTFVSRVLNFESPPLWQGEIYSHDRIRVAYVSSDFHDHATAHLMAGMFENHDRTRFSTTAISFGPDDGGPTRKRLINAFDRFIDCRGRSDREIATLMREMEIDIAVDLKGYTQDSLPTIFAMRPAPIQVNYLGYPGTMGADFIDYLLADRIVVPENQQQYFSEKLCYLPDCYQPNDATRPISDVKLARSDAGLPDAGFVFCSFNNSFKFTPDVFDVWMRLLHQVEGSVLWLLQSNAASLSNLKHEAQKRGIAPHRLVFAPRTISEYHLARHRLADIFLDTLPYNAHTTASDALWAGLPIVTCLGTAFAGRVAASLLNAIGLPELVTSSMANYEALALKLARDPVLLATMKTKVAQNRNTCPLFATALFTRHIESAYISMWEKYQRGKAPATFAVKAN